MPIFIDSDDPVEGEVGSTTGAATGTVKVSSNDTTPGYLNGKLVAGSNITLTEGSDGGNETLTIASSGGGGGLSDGDKGDITVSASGATWTIDSGVVSMAKLADLAGLSVIGRNSASSGVPSAITASLSDQVFKVNAAGTGLEAGYLKNANFDAAAAILLSRLANQAALTVVANGTNSSAAPTAVAGTADQVLRVNTAGNALAFGTTATGGIADDAVTPAKTSFYIGTYTAVADRDFDLTSLPSDTFTGYNIYIRGSASASGTFDILLNDTDTCDSTHYLVAAGTSVSADESFGPGVISASADNAIHIRIWTKTGLRRKCHVQSSGYYTGQARVYFISGEWTDTAAAITQLTLRVGSGDTWTAGTIAEVWGF